MARLGDKSKLLEILAETPIVSFACKKVNLDRRTYYRWYKDDKDFREQASKILVIGRMNVDDMAESVIIKKIHENDMRASIFWLQHNQPRYRPVRVAYQEPEGHIHKLAPGEICRSCGFREAPIEEYKSNKKQPLDNKTLSRELFNRIRSIDTRKASEREIGEIIDDFVKRNNLGDVRIIFKDYSESGNEDDEDNEDESIEGTIIRG